MLFSWCGPYHFFCFHRTLTFIVCQYVFIVSKSTAPGRRFSRPRVGTSEMHGLRPLLQPADDGLGVDDLIGDVAAEAARVVGLADLLERQREPDAAVIVHLRAVVG